ncbi:MAG: acyl carrier protein [Candidatus Odinarchaeota archaeon]
MDYHGERCFIDIKLFSMKKDNIFKDLEAILKNIGIQTKINEETALIGELLIDSLDFMNYITRVEEQYNLKISDSDIQNLKLGIMKNMIDYISERID